MAPPVAVVPVVVVRRVSASVATVSWFLRPDAAPMSNPAVVVLSKVESPELPEQETSTSDNAKTTAVSIVVNVFFIIV